MSEHDLKPESLSEESQRAIRRGSQAEINHRLLIIVETLYEQNRQMHQENCKQNADILEEISTLKQHFGIWETPRGRFFTWLGGFLVGAVFIVYMGWVGITLVQHETTLATLTEKLNK